jgi:hypothetical protein
MGKARSQYHRTWRDPRATPMPKRHTDADAELGGTLRGRMGLALVKTTLRQGQPMFTGERKRLYQREYMLEYMRRKRAPARITRLRNQLVELQRLVGCDHPAPMQSWRDTVAYRGPVANKQSPPCLLDLSEPAPTYTDAFGTLTRWRK